MAPSTSPGQMGYQDAISNGNQLPTVGYEPKHILEDSKEQVESPMEDGDGDEILERWNKPRINLYRYLAALYSFIIMGMNDAAYGVSPSKKFTIFTDICVRL